MIMKRSLKDMLMLAVLVMPNVVLSQVISIDNLPIEEIRTELDSILANEFDRVSASDRKSAVLVRVMNWIERRPGSIQAQVSLTDSELELIRSIVSSWLQDPNRAGDNRISRMCEVWLNSNYSGADRIDEALLAYEIENSSGYALFTEQRLVAVLADLEASLSPNSWSDFSSYIQEQVDSFTGKISRSFFTRIVRRQQSLDTMELHCGI